MAAARRIRQRELLQSRCCCMPAAVTHVSWWCSSSSSSSVFKTPAGTGLQVVQQLHLLLAAL
jgi:hypothetical protein